METKLTKKAIKAQQVEQNKRDAFSKRVRTLTGHMVYGRAKTSEINAAYEAKKSADSFAAELASREPVGMCLHPAKVDAVKQARDYALGIIYNVAIDLAAHNWDLQACAPYPERNVTEYKRRLEIAKHNRYSNLTESTDDGYRRTGEPDPRKMSDIGMSRFIQNHEEEAAAQYDMFICKMVQKVGECVSASIEGSHIWASSILTVTKEMTTSNSAEGQSRKYTTTVVERWKTQQIENVSKLGLYFPQWPSRLLK